MVSIQIPYLPVTITTTGIELAIQNPRLDSILRQIFFLHNYDNDADIGTSNNNGGIVHTIGRIVHDENADYYLTVLCIILICYCFKQLHAFSRPPPVQRKQLPRRPALQVLFKPDDISSIHNNRNNKIGKSKSKSNKNKRQRDVVKNKKDAASLVGSTTLEYEQSNGYNEDDGDNDYSSIEEEEFVDVNEGEDDNSAYDYISHSGYHSTTNSHANTKRTTTTTTSSRPPIVTPHDLPDSFAPLLSSSQMEILTDDITCDLLHATHVRGSIRLKCGRHEIPLDIDSSRPQLILDVGGGGGGSSKRKSRSNSSADSSAYNNTVQGTSSAVGCKITAVAAIGSDGISNVDDLDTSKPTNERSLPLVKHAGVILDPPLPLANVAPTLIHFPTLFEDNNLKYTLRRVQIVRYMLDFIKSMSSLIEKVLWIAESKCQIHLGKVSLTPLYKGELHHSRNKNSGTISTSSSADGSAALDPDGDELEPQWRLSLAFSGHVTLFGWIPIPFVNIQLPTWIIPQPHALLENLLTSQPLASAKLKRENIAEQRIMLAILDTIDTWDFKIEAVATPPALSADLSLSGGLSVAVETMHGTDVGGGRPRGGVEAVGNIGVGTIYGGGFPENNSNETLSTCTMYTDKKHESWFRRRRGRINTRSNVSMNQGNSKNKKGFDANDLVPWKLELALNGKIDQERISVNLTKCIASHDPSKFANVGDDGQPLDGSRISLSGHFVVCKPDPKVLENSSARKLSAPHLNLNDHHHQHNKNLQADDCSVASILLYSEKKKNHLLSNRRNNLLQYYYEFDIGEDTTLDAVSLSIGASHPMLKGGTIITTILENMYAYGTVGARENSIIDMSEISRKRNILKHLPAVGFTAGIRNFFIPEESFSYSDDGQTKCLPELVGGQLMVRVTGGDPAGEGVMPIEKTPFNPGNSVRLNRQESLFVSEGIKVLVDFGVASIVLNNESNVSEVSLERG